ncbi:hypothetical protein VNI00_017055 [Paramarasmius palmivorus]|uniref:Uncharacterized protein n=1 Tax=Paramarasmius palmivorus TaxID=297713 RepID=A0AAW0B886_9AGAR
MSSLYSTNIFTTSIASFDEVFSRTGRPSPADGGEASQKRSNNAVAQAFKPRMDLYEDAKNNVVTATFELPGLKPRSHGVYSPKKKIDVAQRPSNHYRRIQDL